jgi:hypothetical protein
MEDDARGERPHSTIPGRLTVADERVAYNEARAREVNEAIEAGRVNREGLTGFVCECGRLGCNAVVELSLMEYEGVRAESRQFVIVAGHEASVDEVVASADRYAVVCKRGAAALIADETDPRGEGS